LSIRARRDRVDLLHVQYVVPPISPVPIATTIHDLSFEDVADAFPRATSLRLKASVRFAVRRSAVLIAVSEFTKSRLLERYKVDATRVVVTPNGVSGRWRRLGDHQVKASLGGLGLPERFVLHVGNLHPRKNVPRLVRAVAQVRDSVDKELGLVLAGQPWWRTDDIDEAVDAVGGRAWVHRLGYVDESTLLALYSGARVVAYPSLYEGYGLPAAEALACGAVLVASRTTALPEVTGEAAILVDPADVDQLAEGIAKAVADEDLRSTLRAAGPRRAAMHTWDRCAELTAHAYRLAIA
jgi:glycosyltransferase involved in cell wall biosynthesis